VWGGGGSGGGGFRAPPREVIINNSLSHLPISHLSFPYYPLAGGERGVLGQKRPSTVPKETCYSAKIDLLKCQKRPRSVRWLDRGDLLYCAYSRSLLALYYVSFGALGLFRRFSRSLLAL
jgi:hypothetical protein